MSCRSSANDPRLTYRCALGWTTHYQTELQTISCKREYRALLPSGCREKAFDDPLEAHSHFEGIFDCWRDRYAVSGTSNTNRLTAAPNRAQRRRTRHHPHPHLPQPGNLELPIGPDTQPAAISHRWRLARRHPEPEHGPLTWQLNMKPPAKKQPRLATLEICFSAGNS